MLGIVKDEDYKNVLIKEEDKDPNIDYMSEEERRALYKWLRVKYWEADQWGK